MSPLFGNKAEKAAEEAAASAECDRLLALPRPQLAVEVMNAFGPNGDRAAQSGNGANLLQLMMWLMSSQPRGTGYLVKLEMPVREAVQILEHANLVVNRLDRISGGHVVATSLGLAALAEGSVAERIASPSNA